MDIQGKQAMVVGGASGMARATAEQLVARGATVAIVDLPTSPGSDVAKELGGTFHPCDVTDFEGTEIALNEAVEALGGLHIAVNTAGGGIAMRTIGRDGPHPLDKFRQVIDLNLVGTFNLNRLQAWHMSKNEPEDDERGVIVNTASIAAFEGQIGQVAYSAAKAGIAGMALTMARDLGSLGIRVARDRAEPLQHRPVEGHHARRRGEPHQGLGVPEADGPARRVRPAGDRDRRDPDAQRQHDPPRRRYAVRSQDVTAARGPVTNAVSAGSRGVTSPQ